MSKNTYDCSIGSIHESNNYGSFEILELDHIDKYHKKYFKIRFLNTNYETIVQLTHIRNGNVKDYTYFNDFYATGSIHESNNYGPFEILGVDHIDADRHKCYKIKFLKTGYEMVARGSSIKNGKVKDYTYYNDELYAIGSKHMSNLCGSYTIINDFIENNYKMYIVRFDNTGYETKVRKESVVYGCIKDPYAKTIYGVACIGQPKGIRNDYAREYNRWHNMISRCYNPKDKQYSTYGAVGVTVCNRWLCFEYYLEDLSNIPGYQDYLKDPDNYQLDKDITQQDLPKDQMVYSPETCLFVHRNVNVAYRCNTGINSTTGYYGVYPYHDTSNYSAQIGYNGKNIMIGIYEDVEIAAGAYNWFAISRRLDKPLNPVRTLTEEEVVNLDLRDKRTMCYIVNN